MSETTIQSQTDKKHISFSELLTMHNCGYGHNQQYILGNRQEATVFTIFGTATGVALESYKKGNKFSWITYAKTLIKFIRTSKVSPEDLEKKFFLDWCKENIKEPTEENFRIQNKKSFVKSALRIYKDLIPYFETLEKEWEIVGFEIPLMEEIPDIDMFFKGFIDIVLKHRTEKKYKILDFKTCSWGWSLEQKSETEKLYQVILYKKYWCEKNLIDPEKVECAYLLLKRAPAKKDTAVELFEITSGSVKLENANIWMLRTLKKILQEYKLKTPGGCKYCNCGKKVKKKY